MSEQSPDPAGPEPARQARVRRAPRYEAFLGTGALLGALLALVLATTGTADPQSGRAKLLGYLVVALGLLGALAGGLVAVLLERFSRRSRID